MKGAGWRVAVAALAATCAVLVAGCGQRSVQVSAPRPAGQAAAACRALHQRLPARVLDQHRRATEPAGPYVAAWGDPPIVLRCGVPRPGALRPTSQLAVVNGVAWLPVPRYHPSRLVTVGRVAYVEIRVPDHYWPPANALVDLAAPVKRAVPKRPGG